MPCKLCFFLLYAEKIRQLEYFTDIILTRKPTGGQPKHTYIYIYIIEKDDTLSTNKQNQALNNLEQLWYNEAVISFI